MSWNDQNGGPWGKPQGGGNRGGNRGGGGPQGPDFEDFLKKGQDNIRRIFPGGGGGSNGTNAPRVFLYGVGAIFALWAASGIYSVQEGQQAAVLRFGKWVATTHPGINYHFPYPIESVVIERVEELNRIDSGVQVKYDYALKANNSANLMLTGDENIVSIEFTVHWFIKDLGAYLFRIDEPKEAVKDAAESAVREIVAQNTFAFALTKGRGEITDKAQNLLQKMLDNYNSGIQIQRIQLRSVDAPAQVIDAFRDVQRARADHESKINEAKAYSNSVIPVARGEAAQLVQGAQAYKKAVVDNAKGESSRFLSVLEKYQQAPEITRKRLLIEATQTVMTGVNKIIVDGKTGGAQSVLPYLPLPALKPIEPAAVNDAASQQPLVKAKP